jgi:hypothetical protein
MRRACCRRGGEALMMRDRCEYFGRDKRHKRIPGPRRMGGAIRYITLKQSITRLKTTDGDAVLMLADDYMHDMTTTLISIPQR